jgi:hypothetical protein
VAALSLGWQIAVHQLEGRRVRVTLVHGAAGRGSVVTSKVGRTGAPSNHARLAEQGFTEAVIGVAVTNLGRAPVRVDRYSVLPVGRAAASLSVLGENVLGPELPYRLPAGETETWFVTDAQARALIAANRAMAPTSNRVRMSVELGTGDVRRTRRAAFL